MSRTDSTVDEGMKALRLATRKGKGLSVDPDSSMLLPIARHDIETGGERSEAIDSE